MTGYCSVCGRKITGAYYPKESEKDIKICGMDCGAEWWRKNIKSSGNAREQDIVKRRVTEEEKQRIIEMYYGERASVRKITQSVGRSDSTVRDVIRRHRHDRV